MLFLNDHNKHNYLFHNQLIWTKQAVETVCNLPCSSVTNQH